MIVLQSRSGGAAANNLGDRTGSPLGGAAGCSCHNNASDPFSPSLSITVKDASQNIVTSYTAGQSYTIEFNVSAGTGSPAGYGLQAVAISPSTGNAQAGTIGSATTSNTQLTPLNGRTYVEHSGVNASGAFTVNWTAPAAGFGTVAIYGRGIAVNGGGTGGDKETSSVLVNLSEVVPTTIGYTQNAYCVNDTDPTPTITGTTGGTFSATPTGLSINSSTGEIDLSTSTPQAYTVSYDDGTATTTSAITINALDDAQFSYAVNFACQSSPLSTSPTPTTAGGTWSSTSGLAINSNTGEITPSNSTIGSYLITHTTNGACPNTDTATFNILAQDVAAFPFTDTTICQGAGTNPILSVTGTTSGFYSASPAGVDFVSNSTGEIDVNASNTGSYLLSYISNGTCPTNTNANLTISVCSGINTIQQATNYELFPNPNTGTFSIKNTSLAGMVEISVLDILGKVVYTEHSFMEQNGLKTLALEKLTAGTYFVQLQQENAQQTIKVIVE